MWQFIIFSLMALFQITNGQPLYSNVVFEETLPYYHHSKNLPNPNPEHHCDPNSAELQRCPNGVHCHPSFLECEVSTDHHHHAKIEYCICPERHMPGHLNHHNLWLPHHNQYMPGWRWPSHHNQRHLWAPRYNQHHLWAPRYNQRHLPHGETHCDPNSAELQICPNGHHCHPEHIECVPGGYGGLEYCICPAHHPYTPLHYEPIYELLPHNYEPIYEPLPHNYEVVEVIDAHPVHPLHSDAHCDPNAEQLQICPNGAHCHPAYLECIPGAHHNTWEYCICPHHSHHDPHRFHYGHY